MADASATVAAVTMTTHPDAAYDNDDLGYINHVIQAMIVNWTVNVNDWTVIEIAAVLGCKQIVITSRTVLHVKGHYVAATSAAVFQ